MPAFPRTVLPRAVGALVLPEALKSYGLTGKAQTRQPVAVGWSWTETYENLSYASATVKAWLATVAQYWRAGTVFTVDHRAYLTQGGAGGGTPVVNGASQTGKSLATDGWPNSTLVLKAGDLFRPSALTLVRMLTADATSNGSGQATLQFEPEIPVGGSPSDNNPIVYGSSLTFTCILRSYEPGIGDVDGFLRSLTLGFLEVP